MTTRPTTTRLHVNWIRCDGRGLCTELLPRLLTRDQWGYPLAVSEAPPARSSIKIPPGMDDAARDAVNLCPRLALTLTEGNDQ